VSTVATLKESVAPTVRRLGLWRVARVSARVVEPYTPHHRKTVQFYAQFVRPGDLCFDIGANLGHRTGIFRELGARVVAVEPQASCLRYLRRRYGHDPHVTIVGAAVGDREGTAELAVCDEEPELSTLSSHWSSQGPWAKEFIWARTERVTLTTLDALIAQHGRPAFCKIDVEGYERAVLAGLSRPLPMLSFEFSSALHADAQACLERLTALGPTSFNAAMGTSMELLSPAWGDVDALEERLFLIGNGAVGGDIYARSLPASPNAYVAKAL